jgi:zinc-ribbon domain
MDPDIPGRYIHEKSRSHYLELKPDGTYFLFEGTAGVTGTYEVNGADITIIVGDSISQAEIQDGVIKDSEGDKWIRATFTEQAAPRYSKCAKCNSDVLETARFCSTCGAPVSANSEVRPARIKRTAQTEPTTDRAAVNGDPLASMTWLPAVIRRDDFPWELIEAAGWFVAFVIVVMGAINKRI